MSSPSHALSGRGFGAPLRFEATVDDCEVVGKVPPELNGAFYRVAPEWYYPPLYPDDGIVNADGYVSMFRFMGGKVDYRGRWVRTHRFERQREARRQLYGYYRNPYTDDPSVRDPARPNLRTVSNTSTLAHAGRLFTLKEDGLPYQIDPNTLATLGPWDFHGAWKSETFTAHPKIDPLTGEMVAFGYEATGLATDDLYLYRIDSGGRVSQEVRAKVPYVSLIHDMALTQSHVVIPFGGYVTSPERLRAGKIHWGWDDSKPSCIGVIPRDGEARDLRWFKGPLRCMMHTLNAYSEGNKVILYAAFWDSNFFPFFAPIDGSPWNAAKAKAYIRRITLDLDSGSDTWREEIVWPTAVVDLGRVDPRVLSLESRYIYMPYSDPARPVDRERMTAAAGAGVEPAAAVRAAGAGAAVPPHLVNCYGRFDVATGEVSTYFAGPTHSLQECTFIPRGTREGEGYLIGVCSNYAEMRSELVIADAQRLGEGDIARVILPFRVGSQVHGSWADAGELALA
ncbi:MAG: carotenoid oxygenase family protein [Steroidobacteraceae bacterium]